MKITNGLRATAYHEAGHAVIALANKIAVHSVSIKPEGTTLGRAFTRNVLAGRGVDCEVSTQNRLRMERYSMVLLAGPIAERKFIKSNGGRYRCGGGSDYEALINYVSYFCGSDAMVDAYIKLLHEMAALEVNAPHNWSRIEKLAGILIERGEVTKKTDPQLFSRG